MTATAPETAEQVSDRLAASLNRWLADHGYPTATDPRPALLDVFVPGRPAAWNRKATDEEIVAAYRQTGSVWSAGKSLGMAGQSVHERLRAIGHPLARRTWTAAEQAELEALVANGLPLAEIAHRLGRTYAGVACRASGSGLRSVAKRVKKIPRGAGYDKASTDRHLRALEQSGAKITRYARANALDIDTLVTACQRHYPDRWRTYTETHSPIPKKTCTYCRAEFVPANGKQTYCTRDCSNQARADRNYFGGNRRNTIGLAEHTCQLCGRTDAKGLSSHHVLGKQNDQLNEFLVALCPGCHQIVSHLGGRAFVDDPRAWEALIALAWTRRHGAEVAAGSPSQVLYTEVRIEVWDEDEDDETEVTAS